jgi:DNA-binding NtrC family response regulator
MESLKILIVDDEERITDELVEYLVRKKFTVFEANEVDKAFRILLHNQIDIMILDIRLKENNGIDVLKEIKSKFPETEVIMISGHGDMDTVIQSMRLGAIDFLKKPFLTSDVKIAIERTSKFVHLQQEIKHLKNLNSLVSQELGGSMEKDFIGNSRLIRQVRDLTLNAAKFKDVNVFITGESGTGKEIVARIVHFASERKDKKLIPVNCSAIPDTLLESEFFGYRKGSFTGALQDKKGFFELSNGGTLFLDEIADMPVSLQAKLLRVIEEKKVKRLGEDKEMPVDVRIVAATNHDIEQLIEDKIFRLDLYHRLNTLTITIPPLRERISDIEPLLFYFIQTFSHKMNLIAPEIHPELLPYLQQYSFPGNVRELKNLTERALILCESNVLTKEHFPLKSNNHRTDVTDKENYNLEQNEINLIESAMVKAGNNQTKAAELLGISRHALIRRLEKVKSRK